MDKTNVPGNFPGGNFYQRQPGAEPQHQGTMVPGMNTQAPAVASPGAMPNPMAGPAGMPMGAPVAGPAPVEAAQAAVPVVGFLYSISRQGFGEYWPLHVGTNTIGRSEDCDICLREQTVSEHHASLFIRQMKTSRKIIASIRDEGSKNGIFVNQNELTYDAFTCKNRDLITIGNNYVLLLILVDADEMGLSVATNFRPTDAALAQAAAPQAPRMPMGGPMPAPGMPPIPPIPASTPDGTMAAPGMAPSPYDASRRAAGGTMSIDGASDQMGGGTQFLQ